MENNSSGVRKSYFLDLSKARDSKLETVKGRFIRIADASDTTAKVQIAIGENVLSAYETLKKNGRIIEGNGFNRIYFKNEAQLGKWVRVIVSEGEQDYDVDNPSIGTVDSIGQIDTPVEIDHDDIDYLVTAFKSLLDNPNDKRAGLTTLEGATYAQQTAVGTNSVVTAIANVNGIILRVGNCSVAAGSTTAPSRIDVDGKPILLADSAAAGSSWGAACVVHTKDVYIPAGLALDLVVGKSGGHASCWYEVL